MQTINPYINVISRHAHKSTVMAAKWNSNGNWLLTGSRDHLLKVFDIRVMKEFQTFRGHKKEATGLCSQLFDGDITPIFTLGRLRLEFSACMPISSYH